MILVFLFVVLFVIISLYLFVTQTGDDNSVECVIFQHYRGG